MSENGNAYATLDAVDHACEFKNLPLHEGENQVWAAADGLTSNTVTFCLMDYLPMVGNLPAGGMSYVNKQLNGIRK